MTATSVAPSQEKQSFQTSKLAWVIWLSSITAMVSLQIPAALGEVDWTRDWAGTGEPLDPQLARLAVRIGAVAGVGAALLLMLIFISLARSGERNLKANPWRLGGMTLSPIYVATILLVTPARVWCLISGDLTLRDNWLYWIYALAVIAVMTRVNAARTTSSEPRFAPRQLDAIFLVLALLAAVL